MTYEQNVKAILETNFAGFKGEIIDTVCERICMLGTKIETIDRVLEIIAKYDLRDFNAYGDKVEYTNVNKKIRSDILALKGEQE